jgi:hypothetical protein
MQHFPSALSKMPVVMAWDAPGHLREAICEAAEGDDAADAEASREVPQRPTITPSCRSDETVERRRKSQSGELTRRC